MPPAVTIVFFHSASAVRRPLLPSTPRTSGTLGNRVELGRATISRALTLNVSSPPATGSSGRVGVVERRQHPGLLVVARSGAAVENVFLDLEVHGAQVEIVAAVEAGQVDLGLVHGLAETVDIVGIREILVGLDQHVPAERPARIDVEHALGADHAAELVRVASSARILAAEAECLGILLVDAGDLQIVLAIVEALAPFGLAEEALLRIVACR